MAIECDHPRPRLDLPGYVPRRMAWQVPANIPGLPPDAARVIRQALQGVYNELSRQGQQRNVIPLVEDLFLQPGSVVVGVGDGQTITLLPPGAAGYLDPVTLILTDVESPVTVVAPDGSTRTVGAPGTYEYLPATPTEYETSPGGEILGGSIPTDTLLGRDSPGTGAVEYITLTAPLQFDAAQHIEIALAGVVNALLAPMAANTVKLNATGSSAGPTDFAVNALSVLGRSAGNLTNLTATAGQQYLRTSEDGTAVGWARISLGSLPLLGAHQTYANITASLGVAPTNVPLADFAGDGLDYNSAAARFDVKPSTSVEILSDTVVRAALTGDVAASQNSNSTTIQPNVVSDGKLRQSAGVSVIGRSANSTGNVADITAGSNNRALVRRSNALSFEQLVSDDIAAGTIQLDRLAGISPNTVVGNPTASTATPVAAQLINAQITDATIANAKLANMADSTIKGRAAGAGTGAPQDLTAAQVATIVNAVAWNELEETGAGPHTDYAVTLPAHILSSNAAAVFTGVVSSKVGDLLLISHQGTGYTEIQHNVTSGFANRFFVDDVGNNLRIIDNQAVLFVSITSASGVVGTASARKWVPLLVSPFMNTSSNAAGDVVAHNGTKFVRLAGGNTADVVLRGNATFGTVGTNAIANNAVTLAKLATQADDTFLANISGGAAVPTAVALTTLAGAGLTGGADAVLNVGAGAGGSLIVGANDIQRAALTGDVTASQDSNATTIANSAVTLAKMANLAEGTVIGRATSAGTGVPQALTGAQQGENIRVSGFTGATIATSTINNHTIAVGVKLLDVEPTGGDVTFTGFACTGGNTGCWFVLAKFGTGGNVVLAHNSGSSSSGNRIFTPNGVNYVLATQLDMVLVWYFNGRWQVVDRLVGTTGLISNAVTDAILRQSAGMSVVGRSANSTGNVADITATSGNAGHPLRVNAAGTALIYSSLGTTGLDDAAVTLAKMADLAQSRIIGRAEGAGTGVPTALTPTQVVAIIDGENATWTGAHSFTGSSHTVNVAGTAQVSSSGANTVLTASTTIDLNSPTQLQNTIALTAPQSSASTTLNDAVISGNVLRMTGFAWNLTGMVPTGDGMRVLVVNASTTSGTIQGEDLGSAAANRFYGIDRVLVSGEIVECWYDGVLDRWCRS